MDMLFEPLPKGPIAETLVTRITETIISGELKPGDKLPTELEFSEALGVSRNGVREAIKILSAMGVVEIRRSEGTFVVDGYNDHLLDPLIYGIIMSNRSVREMEELKSAYACGLSYIMMKKATDKELDKLESLQKKFKKCMQEDNPDEEKCFRAAMDFNHYRVSLTHNQMMIKVGNMISTLAEFTRRKSIHFSIEIGEPEALPDSYLQEVEVLRSRYESKIVPFMDSRFKLWIRLLESDSEQEYSVD